jgi:hypothetical protein
MMSNDKKNRLFNKAAKSQSRIVNVLKVIPILLLKVVYILPFFVFGFWLLQSVYFPNVEASNPDFISEITALSGQDNIFHKILNQKDPVPLGHFHIVDSYITQTEPNPPLCHICHGTYPHSKEKKVRSLLNLHTGFMDCAVCHARREPGEKEHFFAWVDNKTKMTSKTAEGEYGKYTAKIYPVLTPDGGPESVIKPVNDNSARQYLELKDKFTPDQNAQAKMRLHEYLTQKPVFCTDCHKLNGYIDFEELGFSKRRTNYLTSTEAADMVLKYDTFYMPSVIDFGVN